MTPRQLHYTASMAETPKSSKSSIYSLPGTPGSPDMMDSPLSCESSLTPSMQSMSLGRGRGRPRKQLQEPSYEGYPVNGSEEEKKRWLKQKATEQWRYNMLTSNQADEFREHEKLRVKEYQARKRQQKKPPAAAAGAPSAPEYIQESPVTVEEKTEKSKAQSRLRYVKYIN